MAGMMYRSLVGVGCVALVVGFTYVSMPAVAATSQQVKFIRDIRFLDSDAARSSDKQILKLGNSACKDLKKGTSAKKLASTFNGPPKAILVEASTVLCPKFKAKVATYYTTTTTVPTIAEESAEFLALVAPYNKALAAWQALPSNISTTAQLQTENAPFVAASQTFDDALLREGFTGQVATDARKLATDDAAVIADLQGWTMETLTQGETTLVHDEGIVNGDDNVLRSDLGLPPSS